MTLTPDQDFVIKTIKSRDVHFVRLCFVDALGRLKSFSVTAEEIEETFTEGIGFDASCIDSFASSPISDMLVFPDATTFQVLPWKPENNAVARMYCTIRTPSGDIFDGDSRAILARVLDKAAESGYLFNIAPELEYYYFKSADSPIPLDAGGYFDFTSLDSASNLRRDTVLTLESMGVNVEYSLHERGPSQHQINLRPSDPLSMADAVLTYKMAVKEVALNHGVYASFMPKPLTDLPGSAMHVQQIMTDLDDNNLFYDKGDKDGYNLSKIARSYIAGLIKYAPEFSLITNQYVNSYKRLVGQDQVPNSLTWSRSSRNSLIRVPGDKPDREDSCRLELRSPDVAANPYLTFAVMISAGLKGIEENLELKPAQNHTIAKDELSKNKKHAEITTLPSNLKEAVKLFASSEFMKEILGDQIHDFLIKKKTREWDKYAATVSAWEIEKHFGNL